MIHCLPIPSSVGTQLRGSLRSVDKMCYSRQLCFGFFDLSFFPLKPVLWLQEHPIAALCEHIAAQTNASDPVTEVSEGTMDKNVLFGTHGAAFFAEFFIVRSLGFSSKNAA